MSAIKKIVAVHGFSVSLLAATFGGLYFLMLTLGLIRNPEVQFENAALITGSLLIGGLVGMFVIFKTLWK